MNSNFTKRSSIDLYIQTYQALKAPLGLPGIVMTNCSCIVEHVCSIKGNFAPAWQNRMPVQAAAAYQ
jgi:hypothetical protein